MEKSPIFLPLEVVVAFKSIQQRSGKPLPANSTILILDTTAYNYPIAREWIKKNKKLAEEAVIYGYITEEQ
jgi:hypothetical protein